MITPAQLAAYRKHADYVGREAVLALCEEVERLTSLAAARQSKDCAACLDADPLVDHDEVRRLRAEAAALKERAEKAEAERRALALIDHQGAPTELSEAQHKAAVLFMLRAAEALGCDRDQSPAQVIDVAKSIRRALDEAVAALREAASSLADLAPNGDHHDAKTLEHCRSILAKHPLEKKP